MSHAVLTALGDNIRSCDSAKLDGSTNYTSRGAGLTGAADSATGILSAWLRLDGGNATLMEAFCSARTLGVAANPGFAFARTAGNKIAYQIMDSVPTLLLTFVSSNSYTSGAAWIHCLASWNLGTPTAALYVNDVADGTATLLSAGTCDYTQADWLVGALGDATSKFNGCVAELYFAPGQYLDFSVLANRRKFITTGLRPAYLGADGSLPTGTAPLCYFHIAIGEAVANFATNRATGGNFTVTGSLATGSTSPSY